MRRSIKVETLKLLIIQHPMMNRLWFVTMFCTMRFRIFRALVPQTTTVGLSNVTVPYAIQIALKGIEKVDLESEAIRTGVNVMGGKVTHKAVAQDLGYEYVPVEEVIKGGMKV